MVRELSDILNERGFTGKKVKDARHTIGRKEIKELVDAGYFELYQAHQKTSIFKDADYIISFLAYEGKTAILHGVYKVNWVMKVNELPEVLRPIIALENWGAGPYYYYDYQGLFLK